MTTATRIMNNARVIGVAEVQRAVNGLFPELADVSGLCAVQRAEDARGLFAGMPVGEMALRAASFMKDVVVGEGYEGDPAKARFDARYNRDAADAFKRDADCRWLRARLGRARDGIPYDTARGRDAMVRLIELAAPFLSGEEPPHSCVDCRDEATE